MDINYNYYNDKEEILSDIDKKVLEYILQNEISENVIKSNISKDIFLQLTSLRENILNWYPFTKEDSILEINNDFGSIIGFLCQKTRAVTSINSSKLKIEAIKRKHIKYENLELIAGSIKNIIFEKKFNYIILNNIIDKLYDLDENFTNINDFLDKIKSLLIDNGKIIIITDNKFGIKYFAGQPNENTHIAYDGLVDFYHTDKYNIYGKKELENILNQNGLLNNKFYYPLPDFRIPNIIFSDDNLPTADKVRHYIPYYNMDSIINFNELDVIRNVIKDDDEMFKYFANSFLIEVRLDNKRNDINYIGFNNFRKPEYRLMTIIKDKVVEKRSTIPESQNHMNNMIQNTNNLKRDNYNILDEEKNNYLESKFIFSDSLDIYIKRLLDNGNIDEVKGIFVKLKEKLDNSSFNIDSNKVTIFDKYNVEIENHKRVVIDMKYKQIGYWDLTIFNSFIIQDNIYFFDQEWADENMPVEYILYKSISIFFNRYPYLNKDNLEKELYDICNIKQEYIELFEVLNNKIQECILDNDMCTIFEKDYMYLYEGIDLMHEQRKELKNISEITEKKIEEIIYRKSEELKEILILKEIQKNEEVENLKVNKEEEIFVKEQEVLFKDKQLYEQGMYLQKIQDAHNIMTNSLSWKITKPLRYIRRKLRLVSRRNIKLAFNYIRKNGIKLFLTKAKQKISGKSVELEDSYITWIRNNEPNEKQLKEQRKYKFNISPKISFAVPVYNTPENYFKDLIDCLKRQTYNNWELCLADGSPKKLNFIEEIAKSDKRIKYQYLNGNRGISGNQNVAIEMCTGDFIGLLDHDDIIPDFCLYEIVKAINENKDVEFIYTDQDKFEAIDAPRYEPYFKPGFSIDLLRCSNYISHFSVFKKELMDKLGGLRSEYDGSQDYDIVMRTVEITKQIVHIPMILYNWRVHRNSVSMDGSAKPYAYEIARNVIKDHIERQGFKAEVEMLRPLGIYKVNYGLISEPLVSIIINYSEEITKKEIQKLIDNINNSSYKNYEIIIPNFIDIKNNNIIKLDYSEKGSIEKNKNYAINNSNGEYVIFIDYNIEIRTLNWIEELLGICQREDVGLIGVKTIGKNNLIKHCGLVLNMQGIAGFVFKDVPNNIDVYMCKTRLVQNVSAVLGNCIMIRKSNLDKIFGYSEEFSDLLSDLDICLKLQQENKLIVLNPFVEIYQEKVNENIGETQIEKFKQRWNNVLEKGDPYYNPNFRLDVTNIEIKM